MNYLRLAIAMLFVLTVQCSYADSIPTFQITQANMYMGPNNGSGDNIYFVFTGPGVNITGDAGMGCWQWCSGDPIPDPSVAYASEIFLTGYGTAILGGKTYDPNSLTFNYPYLFDQGGGINSSASGFVDSGNGVFQFNLTLPQDGGWNFNFAPTTDADGNPAYYFTDGQFSASAAPTPEPATLILMGTGLAGIAGIAKKKSNVPPLRWNARSQVRRP